MFGHVEPDHLEILIYGVLFTGACFSVFTAIVWKLIADIRIETAALRVDIKEGMQDHVRRMDFDELSVQIREISIKQGGISARLEDQIARLDRLEERWNYHLKRDGASDCD